MLFNPNSRMAPLARLSRYLSAWKNFDQIRNLTLDSCSVENLVDVIFSFNEGFFAPIQERKELIEACEEVRARRPKFIMELGTADGGTLLLWSRLADPEATIVSIDLPGGDYGGGSSSLRIPLYRRMGLPGQTIHLIRRDSHQPETLQIARQCLGGSPVDFLFIDADHSEAGVRSDYTMYSPLVAAGGLIGFHDISVIDNRYGVRKLWKELSASMKAREILYGDSERFGIGLLYP